MMYPLVLDLAACVCHMLEDIAAWGWADPPTRRLVFAADIRKLETALGTWPRTSTQH